MIGYGPVETEIVIGDKMRNNTPLFDDVNDLYSQYEQVRSYSDLNQTEQEALNEIRCALDKLYDSAKTRNVLDQIQWDRIEENAEELVGEVNDTVGLPEDFDSSDLQDDQYRNMVDSIEREVENITNSLIAIEEVAGELDEATGN